MQLALSNIKQTKKLFKIDKDKLNKIKVLTTIHIYV